MVTTLKCKLYKMCFTSSEEAIYIRLLRKVEWCLLYQLSF